ncbi:MAG TPA: thiamine-phosphate kinase [Tepidisphaeraceae bacterium]|jgi:thiamine-monophosphate kinase|nr:thiamine-phosphate kinase [Tepidisphaeraceae bacterium]
MPGEFDLVEWIRAQHPPSAFVPVPQGDDLAVLNWNAKDLLLVGVDQALDGVHFDSTIHSPRQIGRKVMNRNLSDCAAMACLPAAAVATVALHQGSGVEYARELYLGLREAADPLGCVLVGGDTASWPGKLAVTVTILGKSAGIAPITRGGAKPGDGLYVSGPLGGSILGRHMTFTPRVELARQLAATGSITAMIDLSDGLSRDLGHICKQSGVGAIINAANIPIHADAIELSRRDGVSPLDHALSDGEDHELLFTAAADPKMPGVMRIGTIVSEPGMWIEKPGGRETLAAKGWQHSL